MTQLKKEDLVLGNHYEITGNGNRVTHGFDIGEVVIFHEDDGTDAPEFKRIGKFYTQYVHIEDIKPCAGTPFTKMFGVGKVVLQERTPRHYPKGTKLEIYKDDNTTCPSFKLLGVESPNWDEYHYMYLHEVELYKEVVLTPFQKAGYTPEMEFVEVEDGMLFEEGEIFKLAEDDGSVRPYFRGDKGTYTCRTLCRIKPYVRPESLGQTVEDAVRNPSHYKVIGDVEAIEIIAASMTESQFEGYCLGNILKYRLRAGNKDRLEQDIGKADFYKELFEAKKHLCRK